MKIFVNNYASGGFSLENGTLIGRRHHLKEMLAKLSSMGYSHIKMIYFYDVLGKGRKSVGNSLLRRGELKRDLKRRSYENIYRGCGYRRVY